ncbi:MAG: restriction endonuclease subunit S [Aphanizomenon sp.]|jgi:type I restriction enzyme S subunit
MKLETFFKHFDLLAEAPNGVQKLRELILDLAVRGKLVPQDANDEPAAVLLERIKKEKERLVKEGKVRKSKVLPPITLGETLYKIPNNWQWTKLGQCIELVSGQHLNASEQNNHEIGIPYLTGASDFGKVYPKITRWTTQAKAVTIKNDILLSVKGTVGKSNILDLEQAGIGRQIMALRPILINYQYLYLFCLSASEKFYSLGVGIAIPGISRDDVLQFVIPLPPLNEQKRIVTKVDELMKLCDELEARQKKKQETRILINNAALNKLLTAETPETFTKNWQRISDNFDILYSAPENIGKLRQAILQLAVMGKLVPQNANDEPAAVLLERIKKEKERLVKEGKVRKEKSLEPPIKDNEIPYDLPKGWEWVKLDWICNQITDGTHHTPTYISNGVPFLSVKDISSGRFDLTNTKFISHGEHQQLIKRCYPEFNDVLLTKVGTTGIAKVIDIDIEFSIFVSVALLKISKYLLSPYYIELVINSPLVKEQSKNNTQGVGNKNLVLRCIKSFDLPLPPLAEQKRIVTKVDKLMKLCDELETKLTQTQTEREKIINAAVKQLLTV